ncbi:MULTISPECIES: phosphoribosylamine--glycine ligase [Moraxella]|uniref:phosphoribosylamine--glycine ligase n=1 Tax=Moraxella TaxID=475 RepID=UPI00188232D9|nr:MULTISPECIES: phosphoribosylamine--glycine ligase [Moraxella]MBE9578480.1 phosphoribosylamine--glycine ligase [Moraxella sp. K1664]MBE9587517.1 phosphoribosylamine--glycine ligase [Moraxella sp. K1630]MBE9590149.1 phosphoribosylamine--glycine ligase [Moraxella sp. K127]MBE9595988.1 phosphoribosylamine--glycine ligase [Moraxella sp. K2450]MDH9217862.1 phosphoribosylamine--glycine ligase [Moraxella lacunata]
MKILVTGTGGREHALAWACAKDDRVQTVYVARGNAGTATEPKLQNVDLDITDHPAVIEFCQSHDIAFVLVGAEAPLVAGIVDDLERAGVRAWGCSKYCSQLEGSKAFAKDFMKKVGIPTAFYEVFTDVESAKDFVRSKGTPIVIKADGLAAGKGVIVAMDESEAFVAIDDMLSGNKFGQAGSRVVIEEFLAGEEASFICMIDGNNILPMATSQDHKRIFEGDKGANTGGMGAYSPAPVVTADVHNKVIERVIRPVVDEMKVNGTPYKGFLYAGLMINDAGDPYVIEFNCRFGDPETQPIMMRLKSSLVELILAGLDGKLPASAEWTDKVALGIVLASRGYPESSSSGDVITGLPESQDDLKVFHAGTKEQNGQILTNGGRVLCVTALGASVAEAQARALASCGTIAFDGIQYRRDIGWRAIGR